MRARVVAVFAAIALAACAHAAERVTLANGFTLDCRHHALVDGQMRLYTETDDASYIEFAPTEITHIDTVPDPAPAALSTPTANAPDLRSILTTAGHSHNLDVALLASVVKAESGGNPRARSHAGAQGLMQLMPGTAANLGVKDSYQPEQNVRGGATYLDALLTRYHDNLPLALAAYNAGPAAVDRYHGIPPYRETRLYVARVIREFNRRVAARMQAATN
jgi:soluble lytic murein transglycosylase-like protein